MNIAWTKEIELGVDIIDSHHRQILMAASAVSAANEGGGTLPELQATLDLLTRHVTEHFSAEERVMRETAYPGYAVHHALHQELLAELVQVTLTEKDGAPARAAAEAMVQRVVTWFEKHVHEQDREFAGYFHERARTTAGKA